MNINQRQLKRGGYKATPQRLLILKAINATEAHFTPQELYETLHTLNPDVGLVTVYRTLKLLAQLGLVCEIERPGQSRRYTRRPPEHHHHLVCAGCSKVVNFDHCELNSLSERLARETGFSIDGHRLEFTGLCGNCQKKAGPD